ncbi:riboflavin kinase [Sphingobacterium sp. T2]|nr:riboflavin kinase [Sphingobacterium sp. T2]
MCYIGNRPTIDGFTRKIEVNVLDFNEDIYDRTVRIKFHKFIREDKRFDNLEALQQQIKEDEKTIRAYFK